jgi:diadenosine tetraphosphate (Ap4A) HIT family hydrolase
MASKKTVKLWQIWNVEFARPTVGREEGENGCYQIIAKLVREKKNYWIAVTTMAGPPAPASFAVFDDYGREVEPRNGRPRILSKRCLEKCFYKERIIQEPKLAEPAASPTSAKTKKRRGARANGCRFCQIVAPPVISNALCYAIRDGNPVTPLHSLIIPRRHVESFFDLNGRERNAIFALMDEMKSNIQDNDETVEGFNVGINDGEAAGQSVFHVHVHLIPRRRGDVENPRGGVRGVIPRKSRY